MTNIMQAMVLTGHGGFDKLEWHEDWPKPNPGPGEVLIKVTACGLNTTDINTRTGWYAEGVSAGIDPESADADFSESGEKSRGWGGAVFSFPRIQGADTVGVIEATGEGVNKARIGERVIIDPWLIGPGDWLTPQNARYYGSESDGGFAQYSVILSANAHKIETGLSDAELATFPCAITTAENLLIKTDPKPGEIVVVSGASGGVGTCAIQLAKLRGAKVIGIAAKAKHARLKEMGCFGAVDKNEEKLAQALCDLAGGSVDCVVDVIGQALFNPLIDALRHGGRFASSGTISGPFVEFDIRKFVYKDLRMMGATIVPPGTMARIVRIIENGHIKPELAKTFPLKELHDAQRYFLGKTFVGNVVVQP